MIASYAWLLLSSMSLVDWLASYVSTDLASDLASFSSLFRTTIWSHAGTCLQNGMLLHVIYVYAMQSEVLDGNTGTLIS